MFPCTKSTDFGAYPPLVQTTTKGKLLYVFQSGLRNSSQQFTCMTECKYRCVPPISRLSAGQHLQAMEWALCCQLEMQRSDRGPSLVLLLEPRSTHACPRPALQPPGQSDPTMKSSSIRRAFDRTSTICVRSLRSRRSTACSVANSASNTGAPESKQYTRGATCTTTSSNRPSEKSTISHQSMPLC